MNNNKLLRSEKARRSLAEELHSKRGNLQSNKLLGYLIAVIGLILLASTMIPQIKTFIASSFNIKDTTIFNDTFLTVSGLVLVALGILAVSKSSSPHKTTKLEEVPIYHKDKIVGYRRH